MLRTLIATLLLITSAAAEDTYRDLVIEHERAVTVTILTEKSCGTGFVVRMNEDVFVITAEHVVGKQEAVDIIDVPMYSTEPGKGMLFKAQVIALDEMYDMALLKLDPSTAAHFTEGVTFNTDRPKVGQRLHHIGAIRGLGQIESFSEGLVSYYGRPNPVHHKTIMHQTTCVIYPGSSGGPIFDTDGRIVGIALMSAGPQIGLFHGSDLILDFLTR